jgi:hypothetical protein
MPNIKPFNSRSLDMRQILKRLTVSAPLLFLLGCGVNIPAKLEVRDVASGTTYQTYQNWGQVEKGVGYGFTDAATGKHIMLTNYEVRTLESAKSVPGDSAEAKDFEAARQRGGVK